MKLSLWIPILRIFFGALFVTSAILKLFPIDAFELVLIKQVGISWAMAPLASRMVLLFEFALGVCLGFGFQTKRSLWVSLGLLMAFNVFLILQMISGSGDENCGCFGELIPMDAPMSLGKNLLFMTVALVLLWQGKWLQKISFKWAAPVIAVMAIPALFVLFPMPEANFTIEPTLDSEIIQLVNENQEWDLQQGQKLIVIMYSKCVHCKQLASFLGTLNPDQVNDKLRILVFGPDESVKEFVSITKIGHLDYRRTEERALLQAIDGIVPAAILVEDGKVLSNWSGGDVNSDLVSTVLND